MLCKFATGVGALALVLAAGCQSQPRDVILISIDTLRADRLGAAGYEAARTPTIDALAERGTRFTRAYAPMPRTTPGLASMLTGLWPHHHGSREVRSPVLEGTFLTTPLKRAGFATIAVTANPTAGTKQGFDTDFDVFEESMRYRASKVTDLVLESVREVSSDEPLFVWAHYYDPHWPYRPPAAHRTGAGDACFELTNLDRGVKQSNADGAAEQAMQSCRAAYDDEVAFTDSQVGRLLDGLEAEGRLDRALIILTSDHGENFGEDGLYFAHGRSVHEAGLRVPMIIAGPGVRQGHVESSVFRLIDLPDTALSLLGSKDIEMPTDTDGRDRSNLLRSGVRAAVSRWIDADADAELAYAESGGALLLKDHTALLSGRPRTGYCINDQQYSLCWSRRTTPTLHDRNADPELQQDLREAEPQVYQRLDQARRRWTPGATRLRSVSDRRFKVIQRPRLEGGYSLAMVDLETDPAEATDIQHEEPEAFARMSRELELWTRDIPGYVQEQLTDEQEEQLRALGYVE